MMDMDERLERISWRVRKAEQEGATAFGSEQHRFRLGHPLSEAEVAAVERRLHIVLPEEYRRFIIRVGDGGAGPHYGLLSLEDVLKSPGSQLVASVFPHTDLTDAQDAYDPVTDEYAPRPGSLTLCHEGCGHFDFIVVTGPSRGSMWCDSTVADHGYRPLHMGFLEWYENWLATMG